MATPGKDLRLTVDLDVQTRGGAGAGGQERRDRSDGSAYRRDPGDGVAAELDPNQFAVRLTHSYWQSILDNPDHPLLNKAIQAQLAPGSTFKIIMSVAGLAGRRRAGPACAVQRRGHVSTAISSRATSIMARSTFTMRFRMSCDTFYLHAGEPAGDRPDCAVRGGARAGADRPAWTCRRRLQGTVPSTAVGAQELSP